MLLFGKTMQKLKPRRAGIHKDTHAVLNEGSGASADLAFFVCGTRLKERCVLQCIMRRVSGYPAVKLDDSISANKLCNVAPNGTH